MTLTGCQGNLFKKRFADVLVNLQVHRVLLQTFESLFTGELAPEVLLGGRGWETKAMEETGAMFGKDRIEKARTQSQTLHGYKQDCFHSRFLRRILNHVPW